MKNLIIISAEDSGKCPSPNLTICCKKEVVCGVDVQKVRGGVSG